MIMLVLILMRGLINQEVNFSILIGLVGEAQLLRLPILLN